MGTFDADMAGNEALIDEREAQLLGLSADTRIVTAEEMRKRIPLEDLQVSDVKKERMTELQEPYHHEFRLAMPDGSERWLSAFADVRGNRIFGVNFDVTQRKAAEAALRDSEARLRIATAAAALGVFEWHPETDNSIWANDRIYEIFGRERAAGPVNKQQFVEEYLHPADARHFEAGLREAIETRGSFNIVCRIRRKGSAHRWLQIEGRLEPATTDKPDRLVGVIADITERRRLATRAERLSERLLTVQEQERRNIAQELHDSTVQHLVAASLLMTALRPSSDDKNKKAWDDLENMLGEAMKELRTFSYLMHSPELDAQGLYVSLRQYVEGFGSRSGLNCGLRMRATGERLPARLQRSVFRIVQEGLANAYRHASASEVSVAVRRIGPQLHVIISDDGRGMDEGRQRLQSSSRPSRRRHPRHQDAAEPDERAVEDHPAALRRNATACGSADRILSRRASDQGASAGRSPEILAATKVEDAAGAGFRPPIVGCDGAGIGHSGPGHTDCRQITLNSPQHSSRVRSGLLRIARVRSLPYTGRREARSTEGVVHCIERIV